jgi:hypothetical protein
MLICKNCGTAFIGQRALPGNGWIELVLWLAYLVPGLIYSIWRRSSRKPTCASCGSRDLVDASTPVGKQLAQQHYPGGLPAPLPAAAPAKANPVAHWLTMGLLALLGACMLSVVIAMIATRH